MRFSHLSIYSDLSVYGKHASIRYAFLFELAEAAKKADTTAQWHQPKEIWLMLFFIPIRNHFINRSLSL